MAKTEKLSAENADLLANILRHLVAMSESDLLPLECYCKGFEAGKASRASSEKNSKTA